MSWQTTIAGVCCIAGGIYLIIAGKGLVEGGALITAGIGLWRAKDASVVSTIDQVQQATRKEAEKALRAANDV